MYRITFLLVIFILLLVPHSIAAAAAPTDISGVLKSRKVMGVIYFKQSNMKLSQAQQAEIDRIASLVISQYSPDKIVRVEGFTSKRNRRAGLLGASFARAKSVWYYLEKKESFNRSNLYLTAFTAQQSVSKLQGERVEIAIYENPFDVKIDSYSSN